MAFFSCSFNKEYATGLPSLKLVRGNACPEFFHEAILLRNRSSIAYFGFNSVFMINTWV
jgi:hypothetical protein